MEGPDVGDGGYAKEGLERVNVRYGEKGCRGRLEGNACPGGSELPVDAARTIDIEAGDVRENALPVVEVLMGGALSVASVCVRWGEGRARGGSAAAAAGAHEQQGFLADKTFSLPPPNDTRIQPLFSPLCP